MQVKLHFSRSPGLVTGAADDDREFLNAIVPTRLAEASAEMRIYALSSEQDPLHAVSIPPLRRAAAASAQLSLEITIADYESHANVRAAFAPFLREKLRTILSLGDTGAPVGAGALTRG